MPSAWLFTKEFLALIRKGVSNDDFCMTVSLCCGCYLPSLHRRLTIAAGPESHAHGNFSWLMTDLSIRKMKPAETIFHDLSLCTTMSRRKRLQTAFCQFYYAY